MEIQNKIVNNFLLSTKYFDHFCEKETYEKRKFFLKRILFNKNLDYINLEFI